MRDERKVRAQRQRLRGHVIVSREDNGDAFHPANIVDRTLTPLDRHIADDGLVPVGCVELAALDVVNVIEVVGPQGSHNLSRFAETQLVDLHGGSANGHVGLEH